MEKQEIISSGLLEMYVMGATSSEESLQVERWRAMYVEVNEEIINIEKSFEAYAFANAITPSSSVKDQIFNKIKSTENFISTSEKNQNNNHQYQHPAKVVSISPLRNVAAAAAVLVLIGSSALNFFYYNKYKVANENYNESQQQIASLNERLTDVNNEMGIVQSKYSEPVFLKGLEAAPDAAAKIFWMKNTGEVYVDPSNLPIAPAGKQYQLWAIVDGKPVDGGLIITNDKGKKFRMQKMHAFGRAEFFAISLETEGGNPTPTKVVSMGKI